MGDTNLIKFSVNGTQFTVVNPSANDKLIAWLRKKALLTGTKHMCLEGGCGACVVSLKRIIAGTGETEILSVNSCLYPLISANNCEITTVEGLGSCRSGYGSIQKKFAESSATQCGYCTPGFVVATHNLLENNPNLTAEEAEAALDGNICRCTGYRPIFDAVKSFCKGNCENGIVDIEDSGCCVKKGVNLDLNNTSTLCLKSDDFESWVWLEPNSLAELIELVKQNVNKKIRFVSGFTSIGVFPEQEYDVYLDVNHVPELHKIVESDDYLTVGANVAIYKLNECLKKFKDTDSRLAALYKLTNIMANTHVRNTGSWVGNLVMKKIHPSFASDMFTGMNGVGVSLSIVDCVSGTTTDCPLIGDHGFMSMDLTGKVVVSAKIAKTTITLGHTFANSYKVKPRHQNSVAHVNACFTAVASSYTITKTPSFVFGGISSDFIHASNTEAYIVGKDLNSEDTLKGALSTLQSEVKPTMENAADTSVDYRKSVACGLFYKFYLSLCNPKCVAENIKSASEDLSRGVSSATQTYKTDPSTYPVSEAIPKITALKQSAGELKYIGDLTAPADEAYATFVIASVANADIDEIDSTEASIMLGFKKIITAKDLGNLKNTVFLPGVIYEPQVLLATDHVDYVGQPVAIVVADSEENAFLIAKAVQVSYKNQQSGVYTTKDAAAEGLFIKGYTQNFSVGDADTAIANAAHKISGEVNTGCQYHFYMETQICRAVQTDIGMELYCATQCQDWIQSIAAEVLGWSSNRINVITTRLGGSYGGKAPNSIISGMGAVVASYLSDSSVRFVTNMEQCMTSFGRRPDYNISYTVGFDDRGILKGIDITYIADAGITANQADIIAPFAKLYADSAYHCDNWKVETKITRTNTATSSQTRSPCSAQLSFAINHIVDHVANSLNQETSSIQKLNFYQKNQLNLIGEPLPYCSLSSLQDELIESADVINRQVAIDRFNRQNIWKKKGLALTAIKFPLPWLGGYFTVLVTVYHNDGSVVVSLGGIEMGQGMDTKVAQAVAYALGISMDLITIQCSSSVTTPNSVGTGGSIGSDLNCVGALACCKILNQLIIPVKKASKPNISWPDLIAKCYRKGINLTAQYMSDPESEETVTYNTYGVACSEVELDVLTGVYNLKQVDLLYDCGVSINPDIDIGQVEGAFMMGVGMHTTENMTYDTSSGQLINKSTWTYKPPMGKDIPEIWNITLLPDAPNPNGVLRSKASGEPPLCLSDSVLFSLKKCVQSFRGSYDYVQIDSPATVESIHQYCNISLDQMTLK